MIEEKGPWVAAYSNDKAFIESDDFTHDVRLYVSGDFENIEQRVEYAEEIAKRLNTFASRDAEVIDLVANNNELAARISELLGKLDVERDEAIGLELIIATDTGSESVVSRLQDERDLLSKQVTLLRDVLKTIYEDFDCDKNAHDYGTDCRCCIAEKALAATEPK